MYRTVIQKLKNWKNAENRKPLVIKGARQVGKTWSVRYFGENYYENMAYVNFDSDKTAKEIFELDYDTERLISRLGLHTHTEITPGATLIFLDEVQECPRALEALKYFEERAPEYHVVVAGSLLGVYLHENHSFPVGKVNFITVGPLSFTEFLRAVGEEQIAAKIEARDFDLIGPFHDKLVDYYKTYTITGGMPGVVSEYVRNKNLVAVRAAQMDILEAYRRDFSKHAPAVEVPRIIEIFGVVPRILAKENKKFMFGAIRQSARAREYEVALLWLLNAGLVTKVTRVNKVGLPLKSYEESNNFKLYSLDVGLLGAQAGIAPEAIYGGSEFMEEFKGAMAEQFVCQELAASGVTPFYYSKDDSRMEVDFMVDNKLAPLPIEVKSGTVVSSKSFSGFLAENPKLPRAIKFSLLPYKENERVVNTPIYLAGETFAL